MRPGCFVALIEFLNKFAVSHHAVTASPFCTSARQITLTLTLTVTLTLTLTQTLTLTLTLT